MERTWQKRSLPRRVYSRSFSTPQVVGLQEAATGRAFANTVGFLERHLEQHAYAADASIGHARMGMRLLVYARNGVAVGDVCEDRRAETRFNVTST